jgi:metal-responsive CopG/Arc/MetJ family transcriptional regulator
MRTTPISVRVASNLLASLDEMSYGLGLSRSETIREACIQYIVSSIEDPLDKQYVTGYLRFPEEDDGDDWRATLAAEVLGEEDWSDFYESDQ